MNYLAHLYLAGDDPESVVGSLMGDFVKGRIGEDLAPGIRWGIRQHRLIDAFTDRHATFRASKRRLRPAFRRYGGILVDLFYDHFLAAHWSRYSEVPLTDFSRRVYRILWRRQQGLPPRMQRSVSYMIDRDLLQSYGEVNGIRRALEGLEGRLKRQSQLSDAVLDLEQNYRALAVDFSDFFPELIRYVDEVARSHAEQPRGFLDTTGGDE